MIKKLAVPRCRLTNDCTRCPGVLFRCEILESADVLSFYPSTTRNAPSCSSSTRPQFLLTRRRLCATAPLRRLAPVCHGALRLHLSRLLARAQPDWRSACRRCAVWSVCGLVSLASACCLPWAIGGVTWAHARTALVVVVEARRVHGRCIIWSEGLGVRAREASLNVAAACVGQRLRHPMVLLSARNDSQRVGRCHI